MASAQNAKAQIDERFKKIPPRIFTAFIPVVSIHNKDGGMELARFFKLNGTRYQFENKSFANGNLIDNFLIHCTMSCADENGKCLSILAKVLNSVSEDDKQTFLRNFPEIASALPS